MKIKLALLAIIPALMLTSCIWGTVDDDFAPRQSYYSPVVMPRADFENAVQLQNAKPVVKSGKIYIVDNLLFVNDVNAGFHVYDYTNPSSPVAKAFINLPGATDVAIRNNVLYVNQATDLVTLSYNQDLNTLSVTKRNRNVFPTKLSPDGFQEFVPDGNVVVNWVAN